MEEYLMETPSIDYMNPLFQDKVRELMNQSESLLGMKFLIHGTLKQMWFQELPVRCLKIKLESAGQNLVFLQHF